MDQVKEQIMSDSIKDDLKTKDDLDKKLSQKLRQSQK